MPDRHVVAALTAWMGGPVPEGVTISVGAGSGPTGLFLATPGGELQIS